MDSSPSTPTCPECHRPLEAGRAQGLCPHCLLARVAGLTGIDSDPGAASAATPAPELPVVAAAFPQLEVVELVGRGGMGLVYRARQRSLDRWVALKLLAPGREHDPEFARRFATEARALAALSHPNIVTVHDFGFAPAPSGVEAEGFYFLLMEFVDGVNLRQAMKAGRFTPEQALAIVPPVCEALQYAHERGIVHRDIKPENLLLDRDGRVKIADFGIARILGQPTSTGTASGEETIAVPSSGTTTRYTAAGTPQYMAPEQRDPSARTDHRADIYSLGVVLYELLTGELPGRRLDPPSAKVQVDVRLDEVVLRALSVQPELRYATAAEFRTELAALGTSLPVGSSPRNPPRDLRRGQALLATPEELNSFQGQLTHARTLGVLVLDEERLTHTTGSGTTVIPLRAIRNLSIGRHARTMNPLGLTVLSVVYEADGREHRRLISPVGGWFELPYSWDRRVVDWHAAVKEAVRAATGRSPSETPTDQVEIPGRAQWSTWQGTLMIGAPMIGFLVMFLGLQWGRMTQPGTVAWPAMVSSLSVMLGVIAGFLWMTRARRTGLAARGPGRTTGWVLMAVALLVAGLVGTLQARQVASTRERLQADLARQQAVLGDLAAKRTHFADRRAQAERSGTTPPDPAEGSWLEERAFAAQSRETELRIKLNGSSPARAAAMGLLPAVPLLLGGGWLVRRRSAAPSGTGILVVLWIVATAFLAMGIVAPPGQGPLRALKARPGGRVQSLRLKPVQVKENVLLLEIHSQVDTAPVELLAALDVPPIAADVPTIPEDPPAGPSGAGIWARAGAPPGNRPWRIAPVGGSVWVVGFAFRNAAAAEETFRGLTEQDLIESESGRWMMPETITSDGTRQTMWIESRPVALPGDPAWLELSGRSEHNDRMSALMWELKCSSAGSVWLRYGNESLQMPTSTSPGGNGVVVGLSAIAPSAGQVRLRLDANGQVRVFEFEGELTEFRDQLLASAAFAGRPRPGELTRLCRVGDRDVTLQVFAIGPEVPQ